MMIIQEIRDEFKRKLQNEEFVENANKTGSRTIEIVNAAFLVPPEEVSLFGAVNHEYIKREMEWYLSESLNVNAFPGGPPKIWVQVAGSTGLINSNYGHCIFSVSNGSQYTGALKAIEDDLGTRRALMIYTRPSMHEDYNHTGMSDFICTNTVQYLVRDDKLHSMVSMRSNDALIGFRNDLHWQRYVHSRLLGDVQKKYPQVTLGDLWWNAGSLHVYARNFNLVDENYTSKD